ncbi:MAG: hypothetical protein GX369_08595 [Euryarchaeota archaeon]|nr:hypothetical protein [Euryarchaeota archaeon]
MFPERRIVLRLEHNGIIEYDYPAQIQATIYRSFRLTNLGRKIHKARYSLFSYLLSPEKGIYLQKGFKSQNGRWVLRFSSALEEVLDLFIVSIRETFAVGKSTCKVLDVCEEPLLDKDIFFAGPIVIFRKDAESVYMDWFDPDFQVGVETGLSKRYEYLTGETMPEVKFCFLKEPNKKLFLYKGRKLLGYSGEIVLKGSAQTKQFAQCVGLGRWPSAGMGMVL